MAVDESCYLYLLKPTRIEMLTEGPTDEEALVLGGHVDYLTRLSDEGVVHLAGRTQVNDARTFGIVIFDAASEEEAHALVAGDPAVKEGVMSATLYPYKIAILGRDWRAESVGAD